jgi:hypothetical protein
MPEAPKDERTPELDASAERTPLEEKNAGHWQLFGDLLAFQLKLVLDATRDLFLSPISIIAAVAGFLSRSENPGRYFYQLLELGHETDRWINLFGAGSEQPGDDPTAISSDTYVRKVENVVRTHYQKGGLVKNLKDSADEVIDKIRKD